MIKSTLSILIHKYTQGDPSQVPLKCTHTAPWSHPTSINLPSQTNFFLIPEAKWCNLLTQRLHWVKSVTVIILQRELATAVIFTPLVPKCAGVAWHRIHLSYTQGDDDAMSIYCTKIAPRQILCCLGLAKTADPGGNYYLCNCSPNVCWCDLGLTKHSRAYFN